MIAYKLFSGRIIDLSDPRPESVCLESIAHALANLRRFTGHHPGRVSVAEHSIDVANRIDTRPGRMRLLALLHDAHEAYVGDMSRPVQRLIAERIDFEMVGAGPPRRRVIDRAPLGDDWRLWADRWQRAIWDAFGLAHPSEIEQGAIDVADSAACEYELADWSPNACDALAASAAVRWLAEVRACTKTGAP